MPPRVKVQGRYGYQNERTASSRQIARGLIGALIVLVSSAAIATHYLVGALGYAERPLWTIGNVSLYSPFKSYIWLSDALMKGNTSEPIYICYEVASFDNMTDLPLDLRKRLKNSDAYINLSSNPICKFII